MTQLKLELWQNRWSISDLLIVTTFVSLVLALCVVAKVHPIVVALLFAVLSSRVLAIVYAKNLTIALPSVAIALAIPIIISWNEIQDAWYTTNSPDPLSDWFFWILIYPLPIIAAWITDFTMHWTSRTKLYTRFVVEAPILISWIWIILTISDHMSDSLR